MSVDSTSENNYPIDPYRDIPSPQIVEYLKKFDDVVMPEIKTWPISTTPLVTYVAEFLKYPHGSIHSIYALAEFVKNQKLFDFPRKDIGGVKNAIHFDPDMARIFMVYTLAMAADRSQKEKDAPNSYIAATEAVADILQDTQLGTTIKKRRFIPWKKEEPNPGT
ncbi:MAG TPA: hypothetical protein PKA38_00720 [Candidatus Levybacteria bacterium]|nr:hypothetical protein [Candidatus Levybacteria bacterium]